jgi:hypothetical protein
VNKLREARRELKFKLRRKFGNKKEVKEMKMIVLYKGKKTQYYKKLETVKVDK